MINVSAGTAVYKLAMADGSSGWTWTLPSGVSNNSLFNIVGNEVRAIAALKVGKYTIAVDASKPSYPNPPRVTYTFVVGDLGVDGLTVTGSNVAISEAVLPNGSYGTASCKFNLFVPNDAKSAASSFYFLAPASDGTGGATTIFAFKTNGDVDITWKKPSGSGTYTWSAAGTTWFTPGWHYIEISAAGNEYRCYVDGTIRLQSSNDYLNIVAGGVSTRYLVANNLKFVVSNLDFSLNGTPYVAEQLSSNSGILTFNGVTPGKKGYLGVGGFDEYQNNYLYLGDGKLPTGVPSSMELRFDVYIPSNWTSTPYNTAQILGTDPNNLLQNAVYHGLIHIGEAYGMTRIYQYSNWDTAYGSTVYKDINLSGGWHEIRYTFDGTDSILYIDGYAWMTLSAPTYKPTIPSGNLRIGSTHSGMKFQDLYLKINGVVYLTEQLNGGPSKLNTVGSPTYNT
jgi:hypothetical protein